jgi:hypothetical protein
MSRVSGLLGVPVIEEDMEPKIPGVPLSVLKVLATDRCGPSTRTTLTAVDTDHLNNGLRDFNGPKDFPSIRVRYVNAFTVQDYELHSDFHAILGPDIEDEFTLAQNSCDLVERGLRATRSVLACWQPAVWCDYSKTPTEQ